MRFFSLRSTSFVVASAAAFVVACGSGTAAGVYDNSDARAVVVGDGNGGTATLMPADGCLTLSDVKMPDGTCVKPQDECGADGRADVVVDSEGKVVDIVCYPSVRTDTTVVEGAAVDAVDVGNKGAVLIDGANDGVDVNGDVTISGNNSYIFGQGADVSVIGGNVAVDKNNAGIRGVRIQGNYVVTKNNATLVLSVVEGDIVLEGNNAIVAETTVLGNIVVKGNNAQLIGNHVKGEIKIEGENTVCDGNFAFSDANADKVAQPSEQGAALTCGR